ncbi:RNA guanine-9-, methyltransferase domain containing protein, putative [Pediculus humanus corporis]|uniref:RNA (guanine-9-)-methyltransferase domain-containing protein 1 n=1 Tax=Pediculus humanus subsp. corporis TaxID=121224 RepID=E0VVS7_PEDHC|nr:RNA guanine-9-, methyltransferase domain containing protein, putative [Pediculus humanus corporis]EEB17483.1 RNA guanine-9-, methyltransferase domain containing protein, putative [Pediculus humanus corporis]
MYIFFQIITYSMRKKRKQDLDESDTSSCNDNDDSLQTNVEEIFKEISNGDKEIEKKLKVLHFEIQILRDRFVKVPTDISKKNWIELLNIPSYSRRFRYLAYLFKNEKKNENLKQKKEKHREMRQNEWEKLKENHHIRYGLGGNSLFMRIFDQTVSKHLNLKLATAALYSQNIVFDCSYDHLMSDFNSKYCAKQINMAFSLNRNHIAPFHIKFCNANPDDRTVNLINKSLCTDLNKTPLDITEKSYLDIYPKEKLVYLSPHSKTVLKNYNHDDIYIIGAYVDKGSSIQASLAKAKEDNIRMAKFPLDYYLDWQKGMKSLPLNTVLNIMLDMRLYQNWSIAFKNIPSRNTIPPNSRNKIEYTVLCIHM